MIEYNGFIAICSLAIVYYFSLLMFFPFPPEIYVFTFFATLATYNLFRPYPSFREFMEDRKHFRFWLILVSLLICGICYWMLPLRIQLFYACIGAITMLYKFDIFGIVNLRSISYLKLPMIASVWVLTGSIYYLLDAHEFEDVHRIAAVLTMQFLFFTAITIPFDVFGLIEDDMKTIPGKLGVRKSLMISKVFLVLYFLISFLIYRKIQFVYATSVVAVLTILIVHFSPKLQQKSAQSYLLDGTIILQTLVFAYFLQ